MNCGIMNKGNTCYINASLHNFSSMVELWTNFSLHTDTFSSFGSSFVITMPMRRSRKAALDPSQFLHHLQKIVIKSRKQCLHLFKQQDASEIMSCVFDELYGKSSHAQELLTNSFKHQTACNKCLKIRAHEELMSIPLYK